MANITYETRKQAMRVVVTAGITSDEPGKALRALVDSGFVNEDMPFLSAMKGVRQPKAYHPEGCVLEHTCKALDHAATLWAGRTATEKEVLAWAVMLHDVGKAECAFLGDDGEPRFNGHDKAGKKIIEEMLPAFGFSPEIVWEIAEVIGDHMKYLRFEKMRRSKRKKLLTKPSTDLGLFVLMCDVASAQKSEDTLNKVLEQKEMFEHEHDLEASKPKPLITGGDLINLGFEPGPQFRTILDATAGAADIETALEIAKQFLDGGQNASQN